MRKILLVLIAIIGLGQINSVNAQTPPPSLTKTLFIEKFDSAQVGQPPWRDMRRYTINNPLAPTVYDDTLPTWDSTSEITRLNSPFAMWDTVGFGNISYLESPKFALMGSISIGVAFDQICYIDIFDNARLEVRFDNGPWRRTGPATYTGNSFLDFDSSFSKTSRPNPNSPTFWRLGNDTNFIFSKNTNAWVTENFDLTIYKDEVAAQNGGIDPDSMQIRFSLEDDPGSNLGRVGEHIWYLDNIEVRGAPCELVPPSIDLSKPSLYLDEYIGTVYYTGPYDFTARILDQSTIDSAFVRYIIRRGGVTIVEDTAGMAFIGAGDFSGLIPNTNVQIGDSIYWQVVAIDASPCANTSRLPSTGMNAFQVRGNIPKGCSSAPVANFPYYQTFNSGNFTVGQSGILGEDWSNTSGDFHEWWINSGPTTADSTGPSDDYPGNGKYIYLSGDGFVNKVGVLLTPCFDFYELQSGLIRFYVNMNTRGGDTIHMDLYDPDDLSISPDGGYINDVITPISGNKGDEWLPIELNTYDYRDKVVQLRFRGQTNSGGFRGDMAIDSFKVEYSPICDLRADVVTTSIYNPIGFSDRPILTLRNLGATPATSATLTYLIEEQQPDGSYMVIVNAISENWTGNLPPNGTVDYTFTTPYSVPKGRYRIRTYITSTCNEILLNDTTVVQSQGLRQFSADLFVDHFDTTEYWTRDPSSIKIDGVVYQGNIWEKGTPNYASTNTAFSVPNSWDINLNAGYAGNGTIIQLISPFFDFSAKDSVVLSFYNNRFLPEFQDGVWLEASFDRGVTWFSVEDTTDPKRKNWYNSTVEGATRVFSKDSRAIGNIQSGWIYSEMLLPDTFDFEQEVLFRYNFYSESRDGGSTGMSIDNFELYQQRLTDAHVMRVVKPITDCDLRVDHKIAAIFMNKGTDTLENIPVEYTVNGPVGQQVKLDTIFRKLGPRDTLKHLSVPTFDFTAIGDYRVIVKTNYPGEDRPDNDTASRFVEHIDGCYFTLELAVTDAIDDSNRWELTYTNGTREYRQYQTFSELTPSSINTQLICVKTGGSDATFILGDNHLGPQFMDPNTINNFSMFAYNGKEDTIFVNFERGTIAAPVIKFFWDCPPQRSAELLNIRLDEGRKVFPRAKDYQFDVIFRNDGLDSIHTLDLTLQIDNETPIVKNLEFDTLTGWPDGLKYQRRKLENFGLHYLAPGIHTLTAYTSDPNDSLDLKMENDTLIKRFVVESIVDPDNFDTLFPGQFCENFENPDTLSWVSMNPYTYRQDDLSFELGTPSTDSLRMAYSGNNAWVTDLDSAYRAFDSASVVSPFIKLRKDSCYRLEFWHNYVFDDIYHDGGHVQISIDSGLTWKTMLSNGDTTETEFQKNWNNADFIVAIPNDNDPLANGGWTGISDGWVQSWNVVPSYKESNTIFRWRSESDGVDSSDGWAIDDVCIKRVNAAGCFPTGIEGFDNRESKFFLGQNIPNPAHNETAIPYFLPEADEVNIMVMSLTGQIIYTESGYRVRGNHLIELETDHLPNGVYFYSLEYQGRRTTKKMIISK